MIWPVTIFFLAGCLCAWMARDSHRDAVALRTSGAAVPWQVTGMARIFAAASGIFALFTIALLYLWVTT